MAVPQDLYRGLLQTSFESLLLQYLKYLEGYVDAQKDWGGRRPHICEIFELMRTEHMQECSMAIAIYVRPELPNLDIVNTWREFSGHGIRRMATKDTGLLYA